MSKGRLCNGMEHEIHSEEECRNTTTFLGLTFGVVFDDPNGFPRCHYRNDSEQKVDYNKNHNRKRVLDDLSDHEKQYYLAICKTGNRLPLCQSYGLKYSNCLLHESQNIFYGEYR